jgi:hypothetical protein
MITAPANHARDGSKTWPLNVFRRKPLRISSLRSEMRWSESCVNLAALASCSYDELFLLRPGHRSGKSHPPIVQGRHCFARLQSDSCRCCYPHDLAGRYRYIRLRLCRSRHPRCVDVPCHGQRIPIRRSPTMPAPHKPRPGLWVTAYLDRRHYPYPYP